MTTDDQLLAELAAALVPPGGRSGPPAASLRDLHRAIDARSVAPPAAPRRWPRALAIGATAAVAAGTVAVLLLVTATPRLDRETATRITVATTSPALADVVEHRRELETALADADVAAVVTEAARLRLAVDRLAAAEWAPVRPAIEDLLARADAFVEGQQATTQAATTSTPTSTTAAATQVLATRPTEASTSPPTTGSTRATSAPTTAATPAAPPPSATSAGDEDNSGPGGGDPDDGNSGPGGGQSGSGSGESGSGGDSGSGSGSGGGDSGSGGGNGSGGGGSGGGNSGQGGD